MATNYRALELQEQGRVDYEWGSLWPHFHAKQMNWASGFRTKGDVDLIFLSGATGRDPFRDAPNRSAADEAAGVGKVVGTDIREQTRQCLDEITNSLAMMGAELKNIVMFRYYLKRREDVFGMREELRAFFAEHEPDLLENPRAGSLLRGVGLDLEEMLVEIEVLAVVSRTEQ